MNLSDILKELDNLGLGKLGYVYGTILDYCKLPHNRSLFDKNTGLINGSYRDAQGKCVNYNALFAQVFMKIGIKFKLFHIGTGKLDSRIMIKTHIEVDIPPYNNTKILHNKK